MDISIQVPRAATVPREGEQRYSPADVVEALPEPILGTPGRKCICTSQVERQYLTTRMQFRRVPRLTAAFSKKCEYLWVALSLHSAYCSFCRIHRTIRVNPATEARIASHTWT